MAAAGVPGPLDGVRVLAVGADVATRFAAWWLTESGADVAVYRPGWRPDPSDDAEARFERLAGRGLRAADFRADRPYAALVGDAASLAALSDAIPAPLRTEASVVEVTSPFPTGGSFAETQLHDMALWARSGLGYLTSEITPAWTMGEPCLPLNRQASLLAGVAAAFAVATGALARAPGAPPPRRVSFDKLELLALMPMQPVAFAQLADWVVGRDARSPYPGGTMAAADGMVYVGAIEPEHWASLFRLVGELDWAADAVVREPGILREARDLIEARLREWARSATREALVARTQAAHVPAAQVSRAADLVSDPQLAARGFFEAGAATPRLPWLARAGDPGATPRATAPGRVRPPSHLPLAGLRVLDLTWAWAGPFATTVLADLGAEVINVEREPARSNLRRNPPYRDGREGSANVSGWWSANQRGKISLGVDMKTPEGVQVIRDLAARADVVVENFSPGVVGRLGIGYDDLLAVNPRLVYVSMSAYGATGPQAHFIGYGTHVYAASGAGFATSRDGETISQMWIPYPDPVSGLAGAYAIAAYACGARRSGRPAYVDLSDLESMCCIALEPMLAAGSPEPPPRGTESGLADYRVVSSADDRVVALIVPGRDSWGAVAAALGAAATTDAALRAAAAQLDVAAIGDRAGAAGALVAPIQGSADCLRDPDLNAAGFWVDDASPEIAGTGVRMGGSIWRIDGERTRIWRGAPPLYSDTRAVLERVLGYPPDRVEELVAGGAVLVP